MAVVNRIANKAQTSTYDFLTGALKPMTLSRYPNGDGWLTSTYELRGVGTDANIIAAVNSIDELADKVELFWGDQHNVESIWVEESATSETTKRSLIQSIALVPIQEGPFSPTLGKQGMKYTLTIIHAAVWENITVANVSGILSSCGGTLVLPAIDGSFPARISPLHIGEYGGTTDIKTIWGGIHVIDSTSSTDFNPVVELEKGNLNTGVTLGSDSDNASPIGTTDNFITYVSTTDDYKLCWCTLDDAFTSTAFDHWADSYQMLLRCKLTTGNATRIHIDTGFITDTYFIPGPPQYITHTAWKFMEMGTVSIPPFARELAAGSLNLFEFQLYAQSMGTSDTISADCIVLIPSQHYFKISNAKLTDGLDPTIDAYQLEDGSLKLLNSPLGGGSITLAAQWSPSNFVYPIKGGTLVLAANEASTQDVDATLFANVFYYERFRTHGE